MAFELETGSASTTANTYVDEEMADIYFEDRGLNAEWLYDDEGEARTTEAKEAALFYASQRIDRGYVWYGSLVDGDQGMAWPRYGVCKQRGGNNIPSNEIPQRLKDAVCELALSHLRDEPLNAGQERGGEVKVDKVGDLSTTFMDNAPVGTVVPIVDDLLRGLYVTKLLDGGDLVQPLELGLN